MACIYAENGEINAFVADGHLVIDAYQETPTGPDRVHGRKLTLLLTPHDAAQLRRDIGNLLRAAPRPRAAGPRLALAVTEEAVA